MKILQISSARVQYPGGTERAVLEISKRLSKRHEVTILQTNLYEEDQEFERLSEIKNLKIITCKNEFFLGGFGYSKDFKEVLKKIYRGFDIIHIHGHGRFTSDFALRFLNGKKPLIYTAYGFFHTKKHKIMKEAYNLFFKHLKKNFLCTALTEIEYNQYRELKIPKDKIKILPIGIDFKKLQIKKKHNFFENKRYLIYVGRIHKSKGIQHILKAIEGQNLNLLIVGKDAGYKDEIKRLIKKYQLTDHVKIIENLNDYEVAQAFHSSDIAILFSEWESFGLVVLEAMACGIPIIVSDRGSLPLIVKNYGHVIKYGDIRRLREIIKNLMEDPKTRKRVGKEAREYAKRFDWDNLIKRYEDIYRGEICENTFSK